MVFGNQITLDGKKMSRLQEIQDFVMGHKELFQGGITTQDVQKKWNAYYKKNLHEENKLPLDWHDVSDALTMLRREGKIKNNYVIKRMEYV